MRFLALEGTERVVAQAVLDRAREQLIDEDTVRMTNLENVIRNAIVKAFGAAR